jgi:hypothetical protein
MIPRDMLSRLDIIINHAWVIFLNQFLNKKYAIQSEAPFQLHLGSILKSVGELHCLKRGEIFNLDLEKQITIARRKKYIDIVCILSHKTKELIVPMELKFKTLRQSAEDEGAMSAYKDIWDLERIIDGKDIPFAYFFMITNNHRYTKRSKKQSLRDTFNTSNGYTIKPSFEYKYITNKTGSDFYKKNGGITFRNAYRFAWLRFGKWYFLKMKIEH